MKNWVGLQMLHPRRYSEEPRMAILNLRFTVADSGNAVFCPLDPEKKGGKPVGGMP